jgi:hypothetical protein
MKNITSKLTQSVVGAVMCIVSVTIASAQPGQSVDLDALAARGEVVTRQDPLAVELRNQQSGDRARRGFDIGMGAADGQTADGPGKQRINNILSSEEQPGYRMAVSFSLERNRYIERATKGAAIAEGDSAIAEVRNAKTDVFYKLGFDIATAIFGDPARGAQGNTATGPGSLGIRNSLSSAGQSGFNDSLALNLSRRGLPVPGGPVSPIISKNKVEIGPKLQLPNTIRIAVRYKKDYGYKPPSSCPEFFVSVKAQLPHRRGGSIPIAPSGKMRDSGGFYICDYFASDMPLDNPIEVFATIGGARKPSVEAWIGGNQPQPPQGYMRKVLDAAKIVTLTNSEPSASIVFEMVYVLLQVK